MRRISALAVAAAALFVAAAEAGQSRDQSPRSARAEQAPTEAVAVALAEPAARGSSATAPPTQQAQAVAALSSELEQVIQGAGWTTDEWSVLVVSLDRGDTLFSHQPDAQLTPASNLKLFTTAAALEYLGPDYRYATYVTGTGPIRNGVLEGDLLLYGTGDPTVSGRFYDTDDVVWLALADSLAALGVRRIAGDVVGDGSYFEGPGVGRGWATTYITHTYAAHASALSFNDNVATLRVKPGPQVGAPPEVQVLPAGNVEFRNEAVTVASGRTRIEVKRASYDAPVVLTGQIQQGSSGVWRAYPVVDPSQFAASAFADALAERGIEVAGGVRSIHDAEASPVTGAHVFAPALEEDRPAVRVLAMHLSPPLLEILTVINERSHNLYADVVLRTVGRVVTGHGSVAGGQAALHAMLGEESPAAAVVQMDDGSGLSTLNRASARAFIELLAYMERSEFRDEYLSTLPEAAVDRGLRRMHRTAAAGNLRAKTGTIDNVSALSGYVRAANGEMLAFSILSNGVPSTWRAKRIEDRIGARIAAFERPGSRMAAAPSGPMVEEPAEEAPTAVEPAAPAEAAAEVAAPSPAIYVVKSGDTLTGIARQNGVTVNALEEANPGVSPRRLMPGQQLRIP